MSRRALNCRMHDDVTSSLFPVNGNDARSLVNMSVLRMLNIVVKSGR